MQRLLMLVLTGAVTTGCLASMPVSSHIDRGTDFTRYRTYAWGPADALPVTDARLRENPFLIDDLHGAIDRALQARGLERATEERADLLVHFHAAVTERVEVPARLERFSERVGADRPTAVTEFEAGTLVIDLVDTWTTRVVWRGWAEHRLEDLLDDPPEVKRRVEEAVQRLMERLPLPVETRARVRTPEVAP